MIAWIVGSVGPGASPRPTIPSSVWILTNEAGRRLARPAGPDERLAHRTSHAIVSTLVICTEDG